MSDDYLWDRSGKLDPDVERLERTLGELRHHGPAPDFSKAPGAVREFPRPRVVRTAAIAAAAAGVVLAASLWYGGRPAPASLQVARLEGAPKVGSSPVRGTGHLRVGEYLVTDGASRARIDVGLIGEVEVAPNTRVGLLATRPSEHRLALERGTMHARIWAPPGLFFVETPSATAIDLGCTYTLTVDDAGAGLLRVTRGWVAFEWRGRESFVPEGALCRTQPGIGPGTPYREDAPVALRAALEKLDFEPAADRAPALAAVLASVRREDALTLWHLLARTAGEEKSDVFERLAALVPPPAGVTRGGVLAGDQQMLDAWWEQLGLRSASWWRMWKGPAPQAR
jgi:hypothetical protein